MKSISVTQVNCKAKAGAALGDAVVEATVLSLQQGWTTALEHNESKFVIDPKAIINFVTASVTKEGAQA
jgi:hypothetical protein